MLNNRLFHLLLFFSFFPLSTFANSNKLNTLSVDTLNDLQVTSVSRKLESAFKAPAAIYVISKEEIERSGATSIAEALRLAPGIQVANTDSNKWSISSRGFAAQFANKLLVQIDGRSVYTPLFSGVYWDIQDTILSDIKRIEVIRGPGATLWGANAVNGVINIITEETFNTQGTLITGLSGNQETGTISARHGGKINDNTFYKTFIKYSNHDNSKLTNNQDRNDNWYMRRTGFRIDGTELNETRYTLQGEIFDGNKNRNLVLPNSDGSFFRAVDTVSISGGNILGRWNYDFENNKEGNLQIYYDYSSRDYSLFKQDLHVFDLDWQSTLKYRKNHDIIWGAAYRRVMDSLEGSTYLDYSPGSRTSNLYSFFLQDKIAIIPNELFFTVGSKLEHNNFTGIEVQPSVRLAWSPNNRHSLWSAISRAVRTPSRSEDDIKLIPSAFPPALIQQEGRRTFDSERLTAYEVGYRYRPSNKLNFESNLFFNDYSELRSAEIGSAKLSNGLLVVPVTPGNNGFGEAYGFELNATWKVNPIWTLSSYYTYLKMTLHKKDGSTDTEFAKTEGLSPQNQFHIRSHLDLPHNFELDNHLYFVDNLPGGDIDSYIRFDTRLAYHPTDNVELSIVGQNLFDDWHQEFPTGLHAEDAQIGRSIYGKVQVRF